MYIREKAACVIELDVPRPFPFSSSFRSFSDKIGIEKGNLNWNVCDAYLTKLSSINVAG